jgi:hypothetical protein
MRKRPIMEAARFWTGSTKRRKTTAEKFDAAEIEGRVARWSEAMDALDEAAKSLATVGHDAAVQAVEAHNGTRGPAFTPMRADFEWAKRVTRRLKQLADEIARYQ